ENREGAVVGHRNAVAAKYSRKLAEAMHRTRRQLEIIAAADRPPADRKEDGRDAGADSAGRADSRRSAQRTARRANRTSAASALHLSVRTGQRDLPVSNSVQEEPRLA